MLVHKDPNCGCCEAWVEHLRTAGFSVDVANTSEINRVKVRVGIPTELASCHTARIGRYVLEGHVPVSAVRKLLTEQPAAIGLAVPGMPIGSPGMEVPGTPPDAYEVVLFGPNLRRTFARFRGAHEEAL